VGRARSISTNETNRFPLSISPTQALGKGVLDDQNVQIGSDIHDFLTPELKKDIKNQIDEWKMLL
ncbi:2527_t:CDS:2, partial [Gigaspora rosea]